MLINDYLQQRGPRTHEMNNYTIGASYKNWMINAVVTLLVLTKLPV